MCFLENWAMKKRRFHRSPRRLVHRRRSYVLRSHARADGAIRALTSFSAVVVLCGILTYGGLRGWDAFSARISKIEILKIKSVEISGTHNVSKEEVSVLLPFEAGDNILGQNLSKATKNILKLKPEIRRLHMVRGFEKIVIMLEERIPAACVMDHGKRWGIDGDNVLFPLRGEYASAALPEVSARNDAERKEILEFLTIFSERAKEYVSGSVLFYCDTTGNLAVKRRDGTRIIWGKIEKEKFDSKLRKFRTVWEDALRRFVSIDYINLNYLDSERVLVKPKLIAGHRVSRISPAAIAKGIR